MFLLALLLVQTTAFSSLVWRHKSMSIHTLSMPSLHLVEPSFRRRSVTLVHSATTTSTNADEDKGDNGAAVTSNRSCRVPPPRRVGWLQRCRELLAYKKEHGDCLVPKRYQANPGLANWVSKQRSEYKRYQQQQSSNSTAPSSSLNASRIQILNDLGFCWDARAVQQSQQHKQQRWWDRLEEVRQHQQKHSDVALALLTYRSGGGTIGAWLDQQRRAVLSDEQRAALDAVDRTWRLTQQEYRWEVRFHELQLYRRRHGDCCVPISYAENPVLAHWVSTQRKQYSLREKGKWTNLTQDRIRRLNSIGFAWSRWEYEFAKMMAE